MRQLATERPSLPVMTDPYTGKPINQPGLF